MSDLIHHPLWAEVAFRELLFGVSEIAGDEANWRIIEYFNATKLEPPDGDETAWCAAGLNWCLLTAGFKGTGKPNARSFVSYGEGLDKMQRGAIVPLWRVKRDDWRGHVGILTGWDSGSVWLLGGNQGNTWSIQKYSRERILSLRWPTLDEVMT